MISFSKPFLTVVEYLTRSVTDLATPEPLEMVDEPTPNLASLREHSDTEKLVGNIGGSGGVESYPTCSLLSAASESVACGA